MVHHIMALSDVQYIRLMVRHVMFSQYTRFGGNIPATLKGMALVVLIEAIYVGLNHASRVIC